MAAVAEEVHRVLAPALNTLELFIDTETFSPFNLKTAGLARYATAVEVMIVTWALGNEPPSTWDVTRDPEMPFKLRSDLKRAGRLVAHKADFDRTVLERQKWWPKHLWPMSKWRCTMAQALAHGLPGGLDKLCEIFKVDADKAKLDGKRFIDLFCKLNADGSRNTRQTHPEEWKDFLAYATRDIPAMREVRSKCPKWNCSQAETDLWHLDQTINDRGVACDVEFAEAAVRATTEEKKRLADRTAEITDGMVERTTQRDRLLVYLLLEHGVDLPDMKADTIERRLEDPELSDAVKELLRIRLRAGKASTSKYRRVLQMNVAGRLYNLLQFCGANRTGRWGGRNFQPQNLTRLDVENVAEWHGIEPKAVKSKHIVEYLESAVAMFKVGGERIAFTNVMGTASDACRSVLVAARGKKLCISDLANIEGRKLAWLAEEEWKLKAFADYDAGIGADMYILAYARAFGIEPHEVLDHQRQIGKVMELALGYQGGVGAFVTMVATYGIDLEDMANKAWDSIPPNVLRGAERTLVWAKQQKRTLGLSDRVYIVCEALKTLWREAHPNTVALWSEVEQAAKAAVLNPGKEFKVNRLVFDRKGNWLRIKLPSGRYLCYPNPKVDGDVLSYMGINAYNKRWHRISTYGGKLVENITQASSRDVLADAMPRAEAMGYPIVLTVHDELVTETPDEDCYNDEELSFILATNPTWAPGLPLAAKGFTTKRYRKG